ncbi:DUF512 domain-containing protein [Metallumcola ferriviriculae]|uniref:DUF512 domain-containing protein n=1 Tax=Metallumcola ferriviriculae TaxID=3039180 RepID=A0AAU0UTB9_9FIRM|nr:DUF512 domain-containing protein [Desulfitibacteraceae bacterium MK1]
MNDQLWQQLLQSIGSNVIPITSRCNIACVFCSHRQNPPGVESFNLAPLALSDLKEVAQFLDKEKKIIIGESATRIKEGETFTHPQWRDILIYLRELYPNTAMGVTSNGTLLDADGCHFLKQLTNIEITLSLNSINIDARETLMGCKGVQAEEAVTLLDRHGIPYHGSIVAMPWLTGWNDIRETIDFLTHNGAMTVRVMIPGFTRYAQDETRFDIEETIPGFYRWIDMVKNETDVPVLVEPPSLSGLDAVVEGIIHGSPAEKAGLKKGDVILQVDGEPIFSRVDAFMRLNRSSDPNLRCRRGWQTTVLQLKKGLGDKSGAVFNYDLDPVDWQRFIDTIHRYQAEKVLALTSAFAYPIIQNAVEKEELSGVTVQVVENVTFGGSIGCAGLLTLEDLYPIIEANAAVFDLITVPGIMFDSRQRDLFANTSAFTQKVVVL